MTPGLGFALGAMLCFGIGDLIYKRAAAAGSPPPQFIMLQSWVYCSAVNIYAWATGTLHPDAAGLWGCLAGLFSLSGFYNFSRSLQDGAVSTNAPIFRLNFTATAALAIALLGETLTTTKGAALACALIAVWLLLAERGGGTTRSTAKSLAHVVVATASLGLANFLLKVGLQHGAVPETLVSMQAWVVTAFVLLAHGLKTGPASVLVPIAQMSFVFTALLGATLFREPLNARKIVGLVIAAAALVLFAVA
jgi:drug/metabolite transporter (DMT)-like permease